jgi:hypothetical protein
MMRALLLFAALAGTASPAAAQSDFWIGVTTDVIGQTVGQSVSGGATERELRCMRGEAQPLADRWMTEIRGGAGATMSRYFRLAAASENSDVSAVFSRLRRSRTWVRVSDPANAGDVESVNDPLARASGAQLGEPESFFLAGDQFSAAGVWLVRDTEGQTLGYYRGVFRRERSVWRILHLEVGEGGEPPVPLTAYCHEIGDVDAYLTQLAAAEVDKPADAPGEAVSESAEAPPPSQ